MFRETSHVNHAQRLNHSVVLSSPWLQLVVHSFTYHPSTHPPNTSRYITACDEFYHAFPCNSNQHWVSVVHAPSFGKQCKQRNNTYSVLSRPSTTWSAHIITEWGKWVGLNVNGRVISTVSVCFPPGYQHVTNMWPKLSLMMACYERLIWMQCLCRLPLRDSHRC